MKGNYRTIFNASIALSIIVGIYFFVLPNVGDLRKPGTSHTSVHRESPLRDSTDNARKTSSVSAAVSVSKVSLSTVIASAASIETSSASSASTNTIINNSSSKEILSPPPISKMLVVAGMKGEDYSWIDDDLQGWDSIVYYSDDATAPHHMVINKGREPAVYLTYILENYHNLHNITVFVHATRESWHNDFGIGHYSRDLLNGLRQLRLQYVLSQRYLNLRCTRVPGCDPPAVPLNSTTDETDALNAFRKAFPLLHPASELPDEIGAPCCAQFAVSRDQILSRPRSDYERYYRWIMASDTTEWNTGWIFEYTWHIIFGKVNVDCQSTEDDCSCNLYGWCMPGKTPSEVA